MLKRANVTLNTGYYDALTKQRVETRPTLVDKADKFVASVSAQSFEAWADGAGGPILLGESRLPRRFYWAFNREFWATEESLTPEDVRALINEKDNQKRLKLQKAHALQDMADRLDDVGKRQAIPAEVKTAVWRRDQGKCVACSSNLNLEFDHIIPHSMGGSNTERNLQLLCADCNRRKGAVLGGEGSAATRQAAAPGATSVPRPGSGNSSGAREVRCANCGALRLDPPPDETCWRCSSPLPG